MDIELIIKTTMRDTNTKQKQIINMKTHKHKHSTPTNKTQQHKVNTQHKYKTIHKSIKIQHTNNKYKTNNTTK